MTCSPLIDLFPNMAIEISPISSIALQLSLLFLPNKLDRACTHSSDYVKIRFEILFLQLVPA